MKAPVLMAVALGVSLSVHAHIAAQSGAVTVTVSGRVSLPGTDLPTDQITVRALNQERGVVRIVVTDVFGRFSFDNLTEGRYSIEALRSPFVQRDSVTGLAGPRVVEVRPNGGSREIALELRRGSSIAGTVAGLTGEGVPGIGIALYRVYDGAQQPRLGRQIALVRSGARGTFNFVGLVPGLYAVVAPAHQPARSSGNRSQMFATEFYPGLPNFTNTSIIAVGEGSEVRGVDFQLRLEQTLTLAGIVVDDISGRPQPATLSLYSDDRSSSASAVSRIPVGKDGSFRHSGVLPGNYRMWARTDAPDARMAVAAVSVQRGDMATLELRLRRGSTIKGIVKRESHSGSSQPFADAAIVLQRMDRLESTAPIDRRTAVSSADGRFSVSDVAEGRYWITISSSVHRTAPALSISGLKIDDSEINDSVIDVVASGAVYEVGIVVAEQPAELFGRVVDTFDRPAFPYAIVVYPEDRVLRQFGSPRLRFDITTDDGGFAFSGLPAGAYLIAAVAILNREDVLDRELLERLEPYSVRCELRKYERRQIDFRISK